MTPASAPLITGVAAAGPTGAGAASVPADGRRVPTALSNSSTICAMLGSSPDVGRGVDGAAGGELAAAAAARSDAASRWASSSVGVARSMSAGAVASRKFRSR